MRRTPFRQLPAHSRAWRVFAISAVLWVAAAYVFQDSCLLHSGQTGPCVQRFDWPGWLALTATIYVSVGMVVPIASFVIACVLSVRRLSSDAPGQAGHRR